MRLPFAVSAQQRVVPALVDKLCHNVFPEPDQSDPVHPVVLMETPGSLAVHDFAGAVRGMAQADGHASGVVLIAQGTTLSTYNRTSGVVSALTGTLPGSDDVQFSFTESEGFFKSNGQLYVSTGTAVAGVTDVDFAALLADHGQTAFSSVATMGQIGLFTYGSRFGFSDVNDMDATTALNYYTAENQPDALVAGVVLGDYYYLFGVRSIEPWTRTGNADDPWQTQPGAVIDDAGALSVTAICKGDNALWFVDDARNIRELRGPGSAPIVSEPWIQRLLQRVNDPASIRMFSYRAEGHSFIVCNSPVGCVVFDVLTRSWHTRGTLHSDTWRWTHLVEVAGQHYVGDATGAFDKLSRDYGSEHMPDAATMGTEIVREFVAIAPVQSGRPEIVSIRLDSNKGQGLDTGQGEDPLVSMCLSTDGGAVFGPWRARQLGRRGVYDQRTVWHRCGRGRPPGVVFRFRKSDPVPTVYTGVWMGDDF